MTLHLLVSHQWPGILVLTFEIESHMSFHLFVALARRGALCQLLTEVALGSLGYDGASIWHFLLIALFSGGACRLIALCWNFDSYSRDRMSYDILSFRFDLPTQAFYFLPERLID